ncbi:hypothetical protein HDK77DRAFT_201759 [Phyllosticta capitalensis]
MDAFFFFSYLPFSFFLFLISRGFSFFLRLAGCEPWLPICSGEGMMTPRAHVRASIPTYTTTLIFNSKKALTVVQMFGCPGICEDFVIVCHLFVCDV